MENDEFAIVQSCQKGSVEDFGRLYDLYIKKIYNFIYYKTHHQETAEDLVSIVFTKALKKINTFDNSGTFSAWLYRIARNTVIDHYRTKKLDYNIEDIWDLASDEDIARDFDVKGKLVDVKKYLKNLKSEQRDIIIMRVWQEMTYKEIAEIINKSEASCKVAFSRAIKDLRKNLPLEILILLLLFQ